MTNPCKANSESSNDKGWKFFFALLMVLQIVAIGVMWRTYDAISQTSVTSLLNKQRIESEIIPRIDRNEREIRELVRGNR